jgi:hypothetical protein
MILDPQDWDNMPEPLIEGILVKQPDEPLAKTLDTRSTPW